MTIIKNLYNTIINAKFNIAAFAIYLSFCFPLLSWLLEFIHQRQPFSFSGFGAIHRNNVLLYFIDLTPLVVGGLAYLFNKKHNIEVEEYTDRIMDGEDRMNKMAEFAQEIGQGNFSSDLKISTQGDALAASLLLMRENLSENSKRDSEQNFIAEGKDVISNILRINNKIDELSDQVIHKLVHYVHMVQGALYLYFEETQTLKNVATYAYNRKKYVNQEFKLGYGLIGECAFERDFIYRTEIPEDYVSITSGILGDKKPQSIILIPLITEGNLQGVLEFAGLEKDISDLTIRFLKELGEIIARTLFNLRVNQRTERLLQEAQEMTQELQENEEQLRQNAEEMRATQEELQKSNEQLEANIQKVEDAQKRLYSLLENASEIIAIYNKDMQLTYESPSVTKILGYTPEEMMGGKDIDRLTRRGEAAMRDLFNELLENPDKTVTIQYTYMKKNGQKIFLETTGRNLLHDKAIEGIILNSSDITERKRAEKEERMRSKMQALSENSLDMIMRLSTVGQFFYANPVTKDYLGIDLQDFLNKTLNEVEFSEVLFNYFRETIEQIKANPVKANAEITIPVKQDGNETECIMSFNAIPEFNENELETILFVGHDITEAKRIELEIQDKNRKIQDSINYAQRIQTSILPDNELIREFLPNSFMYYTPRDVVSGDFPWFFRKNNITYIAAVDCTGHGVPGALLSFIGYFLLNNIVDHDKEHTASSILNELHAMVRTTLKQDHTNAEARDGMDIGLCVINEKERILEYSGAHRPLYMLRGPELIEYKGDRKAIGGIPHKKKPEKDFTNHIINYESHDKFFFFSDGMPDQLGGPEIKKYSPKRIRENIVENKDLTMEEFNAFFAKDFQTWMEGNKQIDDVLLIGLELI